MSNGEYPPYGALAKLDDKELLEFCGRRIAPKRAKGFYPAFDITPHRLISKHITLEV